MDKAGIEVGDIVHNKWTDKYYMVLQFSMIEIILLDLEEGRNVYPSKRALYTNYMVVA